MKGFFLAERQLGGFWIALCSTAILYIFFLLVQPISQERCSLLKGNPYTGWVTSINIDWHLCIPIILGLCILILPHIPCKWWKYDSPNSRGILIMIVFCVISISSYRLALPDDISCTHWGYKTLGYISLFVLGGILSILGFLYATKDRYSKGQQIKRHMIRDEKERWWKLLGLIITPIIVLLATGAITWVSMPVPGNVIAREEYASAILNQATIIGFTAIFLIFLIIINIIRLINRIHNLLE